MKIRSVKEILTEIISKSVIQYDLAIAAVSLNDLDLAKTVFSLENQIISHTNNLYIHNALGIRSPSDAESYMVYFHIANVFNSISRISANLAEIVELDNNPFKNYRSLFFHLHEFVERITIPIDSPIINKTESILELQDSFGIDLMAIKRDGKIILDNEVPIKKNDIIYLRGPLINIQIIKLWINNYIPNLENSREILETGEIETTQDKPLKPYEKLLVKLINFTSLIMDFGIYTQTNISEFYKKAIKEFEIQIDRLLLQFHNLLLEAYKNGRISKEDAFALIKFGYELENLSDEIYNLVFNIRKKRWKDAMNFIDDILEETEEDIEIITIDSLSPYINKSIWDAEIDIKNRNSVFDVIALRRSNNIIPYPKSDLILKHGDILLVKLYKNTDSFNS